MVGVLHDFDWDVCPSPEEHPQYGAGILRERGYPEEIVRAVLSHGNHTGISRETTMEKALFAMDELSGFVTAVALVRPSKSLGETEVRSVRKKMTVVNQQKWDTLRPEKIIVMRSVGRAP